VIFISTTEELREGVRVSKMLNPPVFRVAVVSKDNKEKITPGTFEFDKKTEYSNWAKKQLEEESKKEEVEHVVKVCGKPWKESKKLSLKLEDDSLTEKEVSPPVDNSPKESHDNIVKKKTIKERVETLSEEQKNKTLQYSDDITEQTLKYSNQILEGTMPIYKTTHESSINSSEMISTKVSNTNPQVKPSTFNYDEFVNNVSSKLDEYSSNISRDVDQLSLGVNSKNQSIFKDTFAKSNEKSKETHQIVDEKSNQLLNDLDRFRSNIKVNDVNIEFQDVKTSTDDVENQLYTLSTRTNDNTINISDNITKQPNHKNVTTFKKKHHDLHIRASPFKNYNRIVQQ